MFGRIIFSLGVTLFGIALAFAEQDAPVHGQSALGRMFWGGVEALHIIFKGIGSLAGGPDHGAIWQFDIDTRTRSRISAEDGLAWPVLAPDDQNVFALKGNQVVRIGLHDGHETDFGPKAAWRKLIGVAPDGTVLGLIERSNTVQPAFLMPDGQLSIPPEASTNAEQERIALLLQEDHAYSHGQLEVSRSRRGGRGFDVYYITNGQTLNVSDCGDDACGQPSLSLDGRYALYVRSER